MYREGLGVEKDLVQSADWAKLAREQGIDEAMPCGICAI